jgi:phage shock protein PspC (stress-responsive transcriptional regulator)
VDAGITEDAMSADVKKLYRPTAERKIAGVCTGMGDYFELDPIVFRLFFLFSVFFGGLGILVYAAMWILVPSQQTAPRDLGTHRLYLSNDHRMIAGVCGGLGENANLDPVLIRVAFVVLAFTIGFGVLLYVALWMLLPRAPIATAAPAEGIAA